ncbi:hypothetical protein MTO96_034694 [Rhipicephalus appendiculatus]
MVVKGFGIGDSVYARNFAAGPRWKLAAVVKVKGAVSYLVRIANGEVHHRHRNQLRRAWPTEEPSEPLPDYHFRLPPCTRTCQRGAWRRQSKSYARGTRAEKIYMNS